MPDLALDLLRLAGDRRLQQAHEKLVEAVVVLVGGSRAACHDQRRGDEENGNDNERQPFHAHQRSEEHTYELQSLMRISYAVVCLIKKNIIIYLIMSLLNTIIHILKRFLTLY